jgi:hypothetical protein
VKRLFKHSLSMLAAATLVGCASPFYPGPIRAGGPGYVPVQSGGGGPYDNAWGPGGPQAVGGAWTPEMRGAAASSQSGGAWGGEAPSGAARIVEPGSTGAATTPRYGDAGAVQNEPFGSTTALDAPARQLEPGGSGRPLMLQQYQEALEERDALRIEVDALTHQLELMQLRITELQTELQGGDLHATGLEHEIESLRGQVAGLQADNEDLSARLVTAQIRRLEAEKDLIQVLIDNQRGHPTSVRMPEADGGPSAEADPTGAGE